MRPSLAASLALALFASASACTSSEDEPILPQPGGSLTGGNSGSGASVVTGQVCEVVDPRVLTGCDASAPAGLAVQLGGNATVTDENGGFTLPVPSPDITNPTLEVSGAGVITSTTTYVDGIQEVVPVVSSSLYQQMLASNGLSATAGQGAVLMQVTGNDGAPASGVVATITPATATGPFYDGSSSTVFQSQSTGIDGVVWAPGATVGPVNVTLTNPQSEGETNVDGIQVVDGGITFLSTPLGEGTP